jgi:radical SAM protein with 4Fe4S-binding SPASM domain
MLAGDGMSGPAQKKTLDYFGVEVTRRCNLRCPHCFTDSGGEAHPGPDPDRLRALLGQIVAVGGRTVGFSGGEPLLRKDLEPAMLHGRSLGIRSYSLVTNGFLADRARVASLKAAGLEAVQVSLDGVDARDHVAVRACSPRAFYRALRAMRLFRDAGVVVDVAMIIDRTNVKRLPEALALCEALGVRSLRFCTFVPTGRGVEGAVRERFGVEPDELDRFFEALRQVKASKKARVGVLVDHGIGPWNEKGSFLCDSGEAIAYISSEGDLYPCPGLIFPPFRVGNVHETPLAELLASPALGRVRGTPRSSLGEPCRSCGHDACSGGCRGAAFATTGSELSAPVYCNVLRRSSKAAE